MQNPGLWNRIKAFQLDDPQSALCFSERLARENGWTLAFALQVIEEYKKFMYLICVSEQPLTPSDEVDQAWHLHLIYTQSYWKDFCQHILGKEIHHGPTKGGNSERNKFTNWYQETKNIYTSEFGETPPSAIWPDDKIRFGQINFRRINLNAWWLIKKPAILRKP